MDILEVLNKYGIVIYAVAIFFGGRWGLEYFTYFKKTKYNFLTFASVVALIFVFFEILNNTFVVKDAIKYLITYTVVTSCYEFLSDKFSILRPKTDEKIGDKNL